MVRVFWEVIAWCLYWIPIMYYLREFPNVGSTGRSGDSDSWGPGIADLDPEVGR